MLIVFMWLSNSKQTKRERANWQGGEGGLFSLQSLWMKKKGWWGMSKVVLYSALVVEAPAGPGMWMVGEPGEGITGRESGIDFRNDQEALDYWQSIMAYAGYDLYLCDMSIGWKTYGQKPTTMLFDVVLNNHTTRMACWTEPYNLVGEEGKQDA